MNNKITKEKVYEVAKRYGLDVEISQSPGLYVNDEKVELDTLFVDYYQHNSADNKIEISINVTVNKEKSKIKFKHVTNDFVTDGFGAA
ncbi:hypothetical protein SAMN05216389_1369 [Oceanobacillus limi]|uniref:Uncharacterized protein n=1 Tax=Oceanobacillus limi TaxID=930131 RepID=A0A1I0HKS8_9BACI|nr:hypothetical protein [Oceanobacillus limi]SET83697.1 hypothetical protein SAMN05216389_1369 [Oceanobacillus limi]